MSSPKVSYAYADGTANTIRPTSVTYPDGRVLSYDYGTSGGQNDKLSRIGSLGFDGTSNLVQPAYLGLGTQVRTSYSEPDVRWDLITGTSPNPYAGLDRFGRVIDNKWSNYSSSATLDQIKYGYDRASNRIWRENPVAKAQITPQYFDELYGYDGSNRLSLMERGQLAGSPPSSITNKQFAQDWGLDPTGNWKVFKEDDNGDGTWDLNQTRTSNPVNEITAINETAGPSWATPGYDSAGNMTTIPRPAEPTGDFTGVYDAWNRLVELRGLDDTVVGSYEYDGLTRRVVKHTFPGWEELEAADWDAMTQEDWNGFQLTQAHRRDYYYNAAWQILEERVENDTAFDRQYVWGLRYIDGLVFRDRQLASSVERNYALQDANWNVTALTDDNGAVVERYSYSAYGVASFLNPDFTPAANSEAYDWDLLYAGYKWDSESALYQVRYRYLQPALGGWVSRDPLGYQGEDWNPYRYVKNACVIYVDPVGLKELSIIIHNGWETDERNDKAIQDLQSKRSVIFISGEDIDTIQDVMGELNKVINASCDCIKELEFKGHGNQYGMRINPKRKGNDIQSTDDSSTPKATWIGSNNYAYIANVIKSNFKLCDNPTVVLNGCNSGLTAKDKENSWVQKFSDILRATVIANAGFCLTYDYYIDDNSCKAVDKYPEAYLDRASDPFPKPVPETQSQFCSKPQEPYVFTPTTAADIARKATKGSTERARDTALPLRYRGYPLA